jgi:V8-like Glu-specific endopeptidase
MQRLTVASATLCLLAGGTLAAAPTVGHKTVTAQELAAAIEFWTPERRAAAIPMDMGVQRGARTQVPDELAAPEPERTVPGALPEADISESEEQGFWTPEQLGAPDPLSLSVQKDIDPLAYPYPFTRFQVAASKLTTYPHSTVGKVFFKQGGGSFVCSASVIRAHILLIARHCIFDYPSKVWSTNVVFYPGYKSGPNTALGPANGWLGRILITFVSNAAGWQYDTGFIQTYNRNRTGCQPVGNNRQVEFYTGILGYKYGGSYAARKFTPLGYPHAAPFNGKTQQQCNSTTGTLNTFGEAKTLEVGCDFTGGSSGGPWLHNYKLNQTGANNLATSLNSFKWISPPRPLGINGPQFSSGNFFSLLTKAINLPCP